MSNTLIIECGPADEFGRRLVLARTAEGEHRDRFNTDEAFRRGRFAESALVRFGWPLTQEVLADIDAKIVSQADAEDARPRAATSVAADSVCLADIPATPVSWLWPGRIALGKVTLLAGDPGLGKSMVTLDMAARVSRGASWPMVGAGCEERGASATPELDPRYSILAPSSVVLLSAEDDLADTIRPRLEAHGADCTRIHAIRAVEGASADGEYRRGFDLGRDLPFLVAAIERMGDCRLVVIDPISAYLGKAGENLNAEVRALLGPLSELAARYQLAVVAVTHLRKADGAAIHRAIGSLAFVATARSVWMIRQDPKDAERRLLLPIKNNLRGNIDGLAYTVEVAAATDAPVVVWSDEPVRESTDELDAPARSRTATERDEAACWLREFLANGPQPTNDVLDAANAAGFSTATVRRAFREIRGKAVKDGRRRWLWTLTGYTASSADAEYVDGQMEDSQLPTVTPRSSSDLTTFEPVPLSQEA